MGRSSIIQIPDLTVFVRSELDISQWVPQKAKSINVWLETKSLRFHWQLWKQRNFNCSRLIATIATTQWAAREMWRFACEHYEHLVSNNRCWSSRGFYAIQTFLNSSSLCCIKAVWVKRSGQSFFMRGSRLNTRFNSALRRFFEVTHFLLRNPAS